MTSTPSRAATVAAVLALTVNAAIWGTSWWPFRWLEARGLHPLWSTVLIYVAASAVIVALRPDALRQLCRTPALWVLMVAAGTTNAAFNWAVVIGDVVRVILLFYLMPVWAVLLARMLLGEALTWAALARVALALVGVALVLTPAEPGLAWPVPRSLADALGLLGGFTFALNNVLLRRGAALPDEGRALAMFAGSVIVSTVVASALGVAAQVPWPPAPAWDWLALALGLAVLFLASNLALQYGATRLPANVTAVVMLTEVLFAAGSAVALGQGVVDTRVAMGGVAIVAAALLAGLDRASKARPSA